ncbi:MAG: SdrD B-like domain-containing protein, partial [Candidatus Electrothrix sp.]
SYLSADFGYNWATKDDTDNPAAADTGAIGDRIWNDADNDGVQDPDETGLVGITVKLLTDDNGDGVYGGVDDSPAVTTVTGADGRYIFDDLTPGSYVIEVDTTTLPAVYNTTPSGDPDSTPDGRTTGPLVVAPGDVFVNADFGYNIDNNTDPTTTETGGGSSIGDIIYLDADADGTYNSAVDIGIPGVSIVLEDAAGNIIGTAITDENGNYSFDGLPNGDYTVKVVDNGNVLDGMILSSDPDGGADGEGALTLNGADDLDQNFSYVPAGHAFGEGLIGDTVFLDTGNGSGGAPDGVYNAGEGIEGVTVRLYDAAGTTLLATAVTDSNGQYVFGGLNKTLTYQVHVDTATLPAGGAGLTNSVDPDGGTAHQSTVDLNADSDGIVLDQDFGYKADTPNTISGTLWNDLNGDGTLDAGETNGLGGVTVILRDSGGNIVGTVVTDVNGDYSFGNLPDGTYTVDVVDTNGDLNGWWHSLGGSPGADGNSQSDPYTVTVDGTAGRTNTTADFGFFKASGSVTGDLVWNDLNGNGIKETGEPGIAGVLVTATITYENGAAVILTTVTDSTGGYSFDILLLDEDYNASTDGSAATITEPQIIITVVDPVGLVSTHTVATDTAEADNQADNPDGEPGVVIRGGSDLTNDFGYTGGSIGDLIWNDLDGDGVHDTGEPGIDGVTVDLYQDS